MSEQQQQQQQTVMTTTTNTTAMAAGSAEQLVCEVLRAATDTNHETVHSAEAQLALWEQQSGFLPMLTKLCMTGGLQPAQQLDTNARWMAVVYLKNCINKYWRRGTRLELQPAEKKAVRDTLLASFADEPVPQIMSQIAVLISRIARIDCPHDWPELLPHLMQRLQNVSTAEESSKLLLVLHYVVKAFASRRMGGERRVFNELTGNLFPFLHDLWQNLCAQFQQQLQLPQQQNLALETLQRALLCARTLRVLCVYGFLKPKTSENCICYLKQLFERIRELLQCRYELRQLQGAGELLLETLEKLILKQMKTLNEFLETHADTFARFVPSALQFSFHFVFHEGNYLLYQDNVLNFSPFLILNINLMKSIMMCSIYANEHSSDEHDVATTLVLSEFFTPERLAYICEKIITQYLLLTPCDLQLWEEDPESFAQDDAGETWKYSLRPAIETLYMTCFSLHQTQMTREVSRYIERAQQIQLTEQSNFQDILLKDAIYNAAGLASFHFFNEIDFDAWFSNQLVHELRMPANNFRVLRRRIIWMVAQWSAVKFSQDLRPLAYDACVFLMREQQDMYTRLSAARALSSLVSDFEFVPIRFRDFLEPAFNSLFKLLHEAKECETKMTVLNHMALLVDKMDDDIEPFADNLINYLPLLWQESENYCMLRCAILCTLQQLVKAVRGIPEPLKAFLYSAIAFSTNVQEPSHVYLLEEGLTLWLSVIENSTGNSPELMCLCKQLLPIIEMSSEEMRIVLSIIQDYILLDAHAFLSIYGQPFVQFCLRMFDDIRPEGIVLMLKVFETSLKSDPEYSLTLLRPALPYIFKQVALNKDFPMLMSMYLMMLARVLIINRAVFVEVLQELQLPDAMQTILDVWINKMPMVSDVQYRKLFCLAFISMFDKCAAFLHRFADIMQNISDTLREIMREEDEAEDSDEQNTEQQLQQQQQQQQKAVTPKKQYDSLVFVDEQQLDSSNYCSYDDYEYKTYHYDRCRQLALKDPVHKIVLPDFLKFRLNEMRLTLGEQAFTQLMQTVEPDILANIRLYTN